MKGKTWRQQQKVLSKYLRSSVLLPLLFHSRRLNVICVVQKNLPTIDLYYLDKERWMNEWISSFGGLTLIKEDWNTWRKISFNSQLSTTISHADWRRSERGLCCKKLAANLLSHITVSGSQRTRIPKGFKPGLSAVHAASLHHLKITTLFLISPHLLGEYRIRSRFQYLKKFSSYSSELDLPKRPNSYIGICFILHNKLNFSCYVGNGNLSNISNSTSVPYLWFMMRPP
jgi:hypothetical protein